MKESMMRPNEIITELYNYSEHKGSSEPNHISVTTLIGPKYKSALALSGCQKDESLIDTRFKRSSTFGSGIHSWLEKALRSHPDCLTEKYMTKSIGDYTITGSCDLIFNEEGLWYIADLKTFYGTKIGDEQKEKWSLQLSIYRWMYDPLDLEDIAYIIAISQSNNFQQIVPIDLMSYEETREYINNRLAEIEANDTVDCNEGVKYNSCQYCSYICENRGTI
jgi:hypothetical protein